jgi:outer membrane immunogenic protein
MKRTVVSGLAMLLSASAAYAADDVVYVDPAPSVYDWSGFYAGVNLGVLNVHPNSAAANLIQPDSSGVSVGGHAGYNFQAGSFVFGVEGDIAYSGASGTASCFNPAFSCTAGADWTATLRGRAGVAFDRVLVYGTGGVAWMNYTGNTTALAGPTVFPDAQTLTGWTAGGGAAFAVTERVIAGIEALYMDFPATTMNYDVPYGVDPSSWLARVRVSFKF